MKILTYLEAHQLIEKTAQSDNLSLTDKIRTRIVRLSGRMDSWIPPLTALIANKPKTTAQQALAHLADLNLLQSVFDTIPTSQHLFLLQPGSTPSSSWLVKNRYVNKNTLFSPLFTLWLHQQSILESHLLVHSPLTDSESRLMSTLFSHRNHIVSRDDLASSIWGDNWYDSYSDWTIDTTIHNIRGKLLSHWTLTTMRNRGYILALRKTTSTTTPSMISPPTTPPTGTLPTKGYLDYMNNTYNPRRVYSDLFNAIDHAKIQLPTKANSILAINSYSFDNVDTLAKHYPRSHTYFTNFDDRALEIHRARIRELSLDNFHTLYDDIRTTRLQDSSFDLIINDFRLNFNTHHDQDLTAMNNIHRLLKPGGTLILSVVIDARYESDKYGDNQENAPLNTHKPWHFQAQENLARHCHTIPYYKKLFTDSNFQLIQEFDHAEGKRWSTGLVDVDPTTRPAFRRYILTRT